MIQSFAGSGDFLLYLNWFLCSHLRPTSLSRVANLLDLGRVLVESQAPHVVNPTGGQVMWS